jgi:hypothetical protein
MAVVDSWTPRAAPETKSDSVREAIERAIGYIKIYPHGAVKREMHGDNIDLCAEILEKALKDYKPDARVEAAERDADKVRAERYDLLVERDALKAKVALLERDAPGAYAAYSAMYNAVEAERNALKQKVAELEHNIDFKDEMLRKYGGMKAALETQLKDAEDRNSRQKDAFDQLEDILGLPHGNVYAIHKKIRELQKGDTRELTSLKAMLSKEQEANSYLVGHTEEPVVHVPRWAIKRSRSEKCRSCENLQRFGDNMGCVNCNRCSCGCIGAGSDLYKPRTTRAARKAASLAGKLKSAREDNVYLTEMVVKAEQKGMEAVAHVTMMDVAVVNELKQKLAASVPLANAIEPDFEPRTEIDKMNVDGSFTQKISFWLPRSRFAIDPHDLVLYKKDVEATK